MNHESAMVRFNSCDEIGDVCAAEAELDESKLELMSTMCFDGHRASGCGA